MAKGNQLTVWSVCVLAGEYVLPALYGERGLLRFIDIPAGLKSIFEAEVLCEPENRQWLQGLGTIENGKCLYLLATTEPWPPWLGQPSVPHLCPLCTNSKGAGSMSNCACERCLSMDDGKVEYDPEFYTFGEGASP